MVGSVSSSTDSVCVLMATYNGSEYISEQLESILRQKYKNIKVFVLDDCSVDGTYDVLCDFASKDMRLHVHKNDVNIGSLRTFEKLLEMVDGAFFCFSDQDDVWREDKIALGLEHLKANKLSCVFSDMSVVNESLNLISSSMLHYSDVKPAVSSSIVSLILRNPASGCTMLCDSRILSTCLPFPKGIPVHDWWVLLCAFLHQGVGFVDEPLVLYRQHGANQLGASKSGFLGLLTRVFSAGGWVNYARYRSRRRLKLVEVLLSGFESEELVELSYYLSAPWVFRCCLITKYALFLRRVDPSLNFKSLCRELFFNLLPR